MATIPSNHRLAERKLINLVGSVFEIDKSTGGDDMRGHIAILQQGVTAWNAWRRENPAIVPDLSWANLRGANLSEANLSEADLSGAKVK
jgi:uncharacterized protein YjbI with pentapeptide repeats